MLNYLISRHKYFSKLIQIFILAFYKADVNGVTIDVLQQRGNESQQLVA